MRLTFEIAGDKLVERRLERFAGYAGDASPAFARIADLMRSETAKQFESQGRHASGGWKPLSRAYLEEKKRRLARGQVRSLAILHATLALGKSLTSGSGASGGDSNQILRITRDSLEYGSRLPYAGAHQNPRPGSRLPQRRPVQFTETAKREMVRILQAHLIEALRAS